MDGTTFMAQVLAFPKGKHDDGPDAAGMIKDELNRRWSRKRVGVSERRARKIEQKREKQIKEWEFANYPWLAQQKAAAKASAKNRLRMKRYGLWDPKLDEK